MLAPQALCVHESHVLISLGVRLVRVQASCAEALALPPGANVCVRVCVYVRRKCSLFECSSSYFSWHQSRIWYHVCGILCIR